MVQSDVQTCVGPAGRSKLEVDSDTQNLGEDVLPVCQQVVVHFLFPVTSRGRRSVLVRILCVHSGAKISQPVLNVSTQLGGSQLPSSFQHSLHYEGIKSGQVTRPHLLTAPPSS